jgi:hypothetical protein
MESRPPEKRIDTVGSVGLQVEELGSIVVTRTRTDSESLFRSNNAALDNNPLVAIGNDSPPFNTKGETPAK